VGELLDAPEYKSDVGLYGVPGDRTLYVPAVRAAYKKVLNVEGTEALTQLRAEAEARQVARDGWTAWVHELVREGDYYAENGDDGFMDEYDRTITLAPTPPEKKTDTDDDDSAATGEAEEDQSDD